MVDADTGGCSGPSASAVTEGWFLRSKQPGQRAFAWPQALAGAARVPRQQHCLVSVPPRATWLDDRLPGAPDLGQRPGRVPNPVPSRGRYRAGVVLPAIHDRKEVCPGTGAAPSTLREIQSESLNRGETYAPCVHSGNPGSFGPSPDDRNRSCTGPVRLYRLHLPGRCVSHPRPRSHGPKSPGCRPRRHRV